MSVLKPNRNESDFKVVAQAVEIRRELTTYVLRDFAIDGKLDHMEQWFLNDERSAIMHDIRNAAAAIEMANSIFITNMAEYEERRLWQDRAIGYYNRVKQELQFITKTLQGKINVNKYLESDKKINKEIGLISSWRKADNKIKNRLK